jgi:hypothetical protein
LPRGPRGNRRRRRSRATGRLSLTGPLEAGPPSAGVRLDPSFSEVRESWLPCRLDYSRWSSGLTRMTTCCVIDSRAHAAASESQQCWRKMRSVLLLRDGSSCRARLPGLPAEHPLPCWQRHRPRVRNTFTRSKDRGHRWAPDST